MATKKIVKPVIKAEPKVVKFKPIKLELGEVEVYQLKRMIDIATSGTCPADIKEAANQLLQKLK